MNMMPDATTRRARDHEAVRELSYHVYCLIQSGGQACDGSCHRGSGESGPGVPCEECVKSSQTRIRDLEQEVAILAGVIDLMIPLVPLDRYGKLAMVARDVISGDFDPDR